MVSRMRAFALASIVLFASACNTGAGPLDPVRNVVGTWKTTFPVTVYFDDQWCGATPSQVASQDWDVTWVITKGSSDYTVDIKMTFNTSNFQVINGCPDTGVVPEVSPMFLTGNISGGRLTLMDGATQAGMFDFTADNMQGDFDYTWCAGYCQREYSTQRTFILNKQ